MGIKSFPKHGYYLNWKNYRLYLDQIAKDWLNVNHKWETFCFNVFVFNRCSCGLPLVWYHSSPWNKQIEECCQVLCPFAVHRCHSLDGKSAQLQSWWDPNHYSANHAYWKLLKKPHCFLLCCRSWNEAICCCKMTYYKKFSLGLIKLSLR